MDLCLPYGSLSARQFTTVFIANFKHILQLVLLRLFYILFYLLINKISCYLLTCACNKRNF